MKLRLISDLHIDVNREYGVTLKNNDVFTLIAGDICGTVDDTIKWLHENVKYGAFCAGNHIVYDPAVRKKKKAPTPIEDIKERLHKEFPLESDITFMDDDIGVLTKDLDGKTLLIGDVLYTDYSFKIPGINPNGDCERNMILAEHHGLNDFVYGFTREKMFPKEKFDNGGIWPLRPKFYKNHHTRVWKKLTEIVERNSDKNIILMTHHCISPGCISEEYVVNALNASYISDKEKWIKSHPNIKLILSGHVHYRRNFNVGETLYVLNPLGYCHDTMKQYNPETKKIEMWTPNCFIDTETWELTYKPYRNKHWSSKFKEQNEILEQLMKYMF